MNRAERAPAKPDERVGVDVGISNLAVPSTGECVLNPGYLGASLRKLHSSARTLSPRQESDRKSGA